MFADGSSVSENSALSADELLLWAAAGLGVAAILLAAVAMYLGSRQRGYFRRADVRATYRRGDED